MSGMSELTMHKYRDLKYVTGSKPATETATPTVTPKSGGFLLPSVISTDPLVEAIQAGRDLEGMVLGVSSSRKVEPIHPLDRLRESRTETVSNGLATVEGAYEMGLRYTGHDCG